MGLEVMKLKIKIDKSKCTICGICVNSCPVGAIEMTYEVQVDATRCTGCRMCLVSCPNKAITIR